MHTDIILIFYIPSVSLYRNILRNFALVDINLNYRPIKQYVMLKKINELFYNYQ